ncbi:hypothetical protein MJ1_0351 [Nanobdella aerobiophila]|uniref:Uncharacterized protein n=1 Tax=Nanobdella aerobiophila TaxID=2586965 RepID=A0A915SY37_9ARCH|nr:hypothetical protein MJ1_0351 [Nanobdella aerobiophila]
MIFIYNWRDKKHRRSDGAETYIFNIIKYYFLHQRIKT